ncbi:MAG: cytidylate kinase-like family protein [Clostridiales bacterium]|nr:cytidylate kinase-like family protein [Clostridiales bacterium]
MAIITVSRQHGSLGDELAAYLADKLGCMIISREYALDHFFGELKEGERNRLNESAKFFLNKAHDSDKTYKDLLIDNLREMAENNKDIIILGMGAALIFADHPDSVNIRIIASENKRLSRTSKRYNIDTKEAGNILTISDRKHKRFVSTLWGKDLTEPDLFDITFNTDKQSVEEIAQAVIALAERKAMRNRIEKETSSDNSMNHQTQNPVFKNETEEEFARILDMYGIDWMYEPKIFPIEWDSEGNVKMAFSPDFYLPRFDLYLELTTMEQKYVTKKNKKMKMVKELYPGTNIRIVYKKDFVELISRLNKFI